MGWQLKHGRLKADDGTTFRVNDHVYLVCEPPGEPYYLARLMEFLHVDNQPNLPVDSIRVNWYYRPRDINRKVTDTRVVFATMHSDICPLTSLRGKCRILHRSEIDDIDEYRKTRDCFWYERLFDRYIHRYYDVIPVSQVINVPVHVKKVLDERWRFLVVEVGRGKELISAVKSCKRCAGYCASNDSVECAVCLSTYHMNCVRPPLLKKPSRGFAWACGPCNRAQERKLEARNTPLMGESKLETEEDEILEEDDDEGLGRGAESMHPDGSEAKDATSPPPTAEQSAHAKLWPYRYLGQHCRVEDALDYDDRIYPRASSRLGARHQAVVMAWPGRPVEYVKPADTKKKYAKGTTNKKDVKPSKDTLVSLEGEKATKEKRPMWVQDEPPGYVHRGEDKPRGRSDCTAELLFSFPSSDELSKASSKLSRAQPTTKSLLSSTEQREELVDQYIAQAKDLAEEIGVDRHSTNLLDKALEILHRNRFNVDASLKEVRKLDKRKDLKEPDLNKEERKRFEEGVSKFGSELRSVTKHVRTVAHADIVRFYYVWKKTEKGKQIWGNYEGRRGKKEAKRADGSKLVDDVADDNDDSAFDEEKAMKRKKGFECTFCGTRSSRQWRRAPGVPPGTVVATDASAKLKPKDKGYQFLVALCRRCAELWRRYGIQWEDIDEVAKKVAQGGGKAWKRKIDEELLKELVSTNFARAAGTNPAASSMSSVAQSSASSLSNAAPQEPPRKKAKVSPEKEPAVPPARTSPGSTAPIENQKKVVEKVPTPGPAPEMPKPKTMPCSVCKMIEPRGDQHLSCRECRMTVHRSCYGIVGDVRNVSKWVCDMCTNDKNPQVSTSYECVLCPVKFTEHDFVEPPKMQYRRRSEKERERERLDRESAFAAAEFYRRKQEEMNRPTIPREPLKRTAGNNWVHVVCAVWTPEMKFGNAKALEPSEGVGTIPIARYEQVCKVCKTTEGACVSCHQCHAPVHVACGYNAGYTLGFDVTPVKSSRRELVNTVTLGSESGLMSAAIWCKEHHVKTIIHPMDEIAEDSGLNALQLYVRNYKQADLTLTGTVRKANLVTQSTKMLAQSHAAPGGNRRASAASGANGATSVTTPNHGHKNGIKFEDTEEINENRAKEVSSAQPNKKQCVSCQISVSPKWWMGEYISPSSVLILGKLNASSSSSTATAPAPNFEELAKAGSSSEGSGAPNTEALFTRLETRSARYGERFLVYIIRNPNDMEAVARDMPSSSENTSFLQCHRCHWNTIKDPSTFPIDKFQARPRGQSPRMPPFQASQLSIRPLESAASPLEPALTWTNPPQALSRPLSQPLTLTKDMPSTHQPDNLAHRSQPSTMVHLNGVTPVRPFSEAPLREAGILGLHSSIQVNGSPRLHLHQSQAPSHLLNNSHAPLSAAIAPPSLVSAAAAAAAPETHYPHHARISAGPPSHLPATTAQPRDAPAHIIRERPSTPRESSSASSGGGGGNNNARLDSDGRPLGGASASPSLRNLLS